MFYIYKEKFQALYEMILCQREFDSENYRKKNHILRWHAEDS